MTRDPAQLHQIATLARDMADRCYTPEAKEALLEVAIALDEEADEAEESAIPLEDRS